jgi:hypothetical protein
MLFQQNLVLLTLLLLCWGVYEPHSWLFKLFVQGLCKKDGDLARKVRRRGSYCCEAEIFSGEIRRCCIFECPHSLITIHIYYLRSIYQYVVIACFLLWDVQSP